MVLRALANLFTSFKKLWLFSTLLVKSGVGVVGDCLLGIVVGGVGIENLAAWILNNCCCVLTDVFFFGFTENPVVLFIADIIYYMIVLDMDQFHTLLITLGVILLLVMIYALFYSNNAMLQNPFLDKHLLERGLSKPILWLYYNDSDVNQRNWLDFGARNSHALNIPFLNLCYERIVQLNHTEYQVRVIAGLAGLREILGVSSLPDDLQNPVAPVNHAEMNWIRTAVLAQYGGLWVSPYVVCLKPFGVLPKDKVVFFGTDMNESYSGSAGTIVPGFNAVWSPVKAHPMFNEWAAVCKDRIQMKRGGQQIRHDENWDFVRFSSEYGGIMVDPHAELSRKADGKRLQLEDLLASGIDGKVPFTVYPHSVYVPYSYVELRDRQVFGWFLRMSEGQIMESDLAVSALLRMK